MPANMMALDDDMGAGAPTESVASESEEESKPGTLFVSKETLDGKTVKKGDTLTLTVAEVDPETGDIEARISVGESEVQPSNDNQSAFDKAVPSDEGEGY